MGQLRGKVDLPKEVRGGEKRRKEEVIRDGISPLLISAG